MMGAAAHEFFLGWSDCKVTNKGDQLIRDLHTALLEEEEAEEAVFRQDTVGRAPHGPIEGVYDDQEEIFHVDPHVFSSSPQEFHEKTKALLIFAEDNERYFSANYDEAIRTFPFRIGRDFVQSKMEPTGTSKYTFSSQHGIYPRNSWGKMHQRVDALPRSAVFESLKNYNTTTITTLSDEDYKALKTDLDLYQASVATSFQNATSQDIIVVQGPPGSGKTTVLIDCAKYAVHKVGGRVLMTAFKNVAIDRFVEKLLQVDPSIAIVRIRSPENNNKFCSENCHSVANLDTLRFELGKMKPKSTFGVWARLKRQQLNLSKNKKISLSAAADGIPGFSQLDKLTRLQVLWAADIVATTNSMSLDLKISFRVNVGDESAAASHVSTITAMAGVIDDDTAILPKMQGKPTDKSCAGVILFGDRNQQKPSTIAMQKPGESLQYAKSIQTVLCLEHQTPIYTLQGVYRFGAAICDFVSKHIYDGKLKCVHDASKGKYIVPHQVVAVDVPDEGGESVLRSSPAEASAVVAVTAALLDKDVDMGDILIIALYRDQIVTIREAFQEKGIAFPPAQIRTADGIQGDENEFIIFSPAITSSYASNFARDPKRLNVAFTRGKAMFIYVGPLEKLRRKGMDLHSDLLQDGAVADVGVEGLEQMCISIQNPGDALPPPLSKAEEGARVRGTELFKRLEKFNFNVKPRQAPATPAVPRVVIDEQVEPTEDEGSASFNSLNNMEGESLTFAYYPHRKEMKVEDQFLAATTVNNETKCQVEFSLGRLIGLGETTPTFANLQKKPGEQDEDILPDLVINCHEKMSHWTKRFHCKGTYTSPGFSKINSTAFDVAVVAQVFEICRKIRELHKTQGCVKVLVHCRFAKDRSPAYLAILIAAFTRNSADSIYYTLRGHRPMEIGFRETPKIIGAQSIIFSSLVQAVTMRMTFPTDLGDGLGAQYPLHYLPEGGAFSTENYSAVPSAEKLFQQFPPKYFSSRELNDEDGIAELMRIRREYGADHTKTRAAFHEKQRGWVQGAKFDTLSATDSTEVGDGDTSEEDNDVEGMLATTLDRCDDVDTAQMRQLVNKLGKNSIITEIEARKHGDEEGVQVLQRQEKWLAEHAESLMQSSHEEELEEIQQIEHPVAGRECPEFNSFTASEMAPAALRVSPMLYRNSQRTYKEHRATDFVVLREDGSNEKQIAAFATLLAEETVEQQENESPPNILPAITETIDYDRALRYLGAKLSDYGMTGPLTAENFRPLLGTSANKYLAGTSAGMLTSALSCMDQLLATIPLLQKFLKKSVVLLKTGEQKWDNWHQKSIVTTLFQHFQGYEDPTNAPLYIYTYFLVCAGLAMNPAVRSPNNQCNDIESMLAICRVYRDAKRLKDKNKTSGSINLDGDGKLVKAWDATVSPPELREWTSTATLTFGLDGIPSEEQRPVKIALQSWMRDHADNTGLEPFQPENIVHITQDYKPKPGPDGVAIEHPDISQHQFAVYSEIHDSERELVEASIQYCVGLFRFHLQDEDYLALPSDMPVELPVPRDEDVAATQAYASLVKTGAFPYNRIPSHWDATAIRGADFVAMPTTTEGGDMNNLNGGAGYSKKNEKIRTELNLAFYDEDEAIFSYNPDSLRQLLIVDTRRLFVVMQYVKKEKPILFEETKTTEKLKPALSDKLRETFGPGYKWYIFSSDTSFPYAGITVGLPFSWHADSCRLIKIIPGEARCVEIRFLTFTIVVVYGPFRDYKKHYDKIAIWDSELELYLTALLKEKDRKPIIIAGDTNIATHWAEAYDHDVNPEAIGTNQIDKLPCPEHFVDVFELLNGSRGVCGCYNCAKTAIH